MTGYEY